MAGKKEERRDGLGVISSVDEYLLTRIRRCWNHGGSRTLQSDANRSGCEQLCLLIVRVHHLARLLSYLHASLLCLEQILRCSIARNINTFHERRVQTASDSSRRLCIERPGIVAGTANVTVSSPPPAPPEWK